MPTTRRAAAAVVALVAALLPLVGATTAGPASAATTRVVAQPSTGTAAAPAGDPRRHGPAAQRPARTGGRAGSNERLSAYPAVRAARSHHVPFTPGTPTIGGADPTGPPLGWSTVARSTPNHHHGRRTPVGAGRSPPASCGH